MRLFASLGTITLPYFVGWITKYLFDLEDYTCWNDLYAAWCTLCKLGFYGYYNSNLQVSQDDPSSILAVSLESKEAYLLPFD